MVKQFRKPRPPRLYTDQKGRYIKLHGKKIYVKSTMNNKQLVKVIVNNFQKKKRRNRRKHNKTIKTKENDLEQINQSMAGSSDNPAIAKLLFHIATNQKEREQRQQLPAILGPQQQVPAIVGPQQQVPAIQGPQQVPAIQQPAPSIDVIDPDREEVFITDLNKYIRADRDTIKEWGKTMDDFRKKDELINKHEAEKDKREEDDRLKKQEQIDHERRNLFHKQYLLNIESQLNREALNKIGHKLAPGQVGRIKSVVAIELLKAKGYLTEGIESQWIRQTPSDLTKTIEVMKGRVFADQEQRRKEYMDSLPKPDFPTDEKSRQSLINLVSVFQRVVHNTRVDKLIAYLKTYIPAEEFNKLKGLSSDEFVKVVNRMYQERTGVNIQEEEEEPTVPFDSTPFTKSDQPTVSSSAPIDSTPFIISDLIIDSSTAINTPLPPDRTPVTLSEHEKAAKSEEIRDILSLESRKEVARKRLDFGDPKTVEKRRKSLIELNPQIADTYNSMFDNITIINKRIDQLQENGEDASDLIKVRDDALVELVGIDQTPPPSDDDDEIELPTSPPKTKGKLDTNQIMINLFYDQLATISTELLGTLTEEQRKEKAAKKTDLEKNILMLRGNQDVYVPKQIASGHKEGGLYDNQIESVMDNYKQKGFKGVYAIDEVEKIPVSNKMGVILNLDKSNQPGSHWVALYIDTDGDQSVEYYDSYGEDPPQSLMKDIKELINQINPEVYLKFKINKIKQQSETSDSCGYMAMQFLIDRLTGIPFKFCTGYSDVANSEKKASKFKKELQSFGYI